MNIIDIVDISLETNNVDNILSETIEENEIDRFINEFSFQSSVEEELYSDNTDNLIEYLNGISKNIKDEKYSLEEALNMFEGLNNIFEVGEENIEESLLTKINELEDNKLDNICDSFENIYGPVPDIDEEDLETISNEEEVSQEGIVNFVSEKLKERRRRKQADKYIKDIEKYLKRYNIRIKSPRYRILTIRVQPEYTLGTYGKIYLLLIFLFIVFLFIRGLWLSNTERQARFIMNMRENYQPDKTVILLPKTQLDKAITAIDNIFDDGIKAVKNMVSGKAMGESRTAFFKSDDLHKINAQKGSLWRVNKKTLRLHEDTLDNLGYSKGDFEKYKKLHQDMKKKLTTWINQLLAIEPSGHLNKKALREITKVMKYAYKVVMFQLYLTCQALGSTS